MRIEVKISLGRELHGVADQIDQIWRKRVTSPKHLLRHPVFDLVGQINCLLACLSRQEI
jgi:hypothetical protein